MRESLAALYKPQSIPTPPFHPQQRQHTETMNLDIYRRQARNLAWYDQDGEPSSHNPFKKFRRTPRRTNSVQLEEQPGVHSQSMDDLRLSEGTERRRNFTRDIGGPEHSDTLPPESAGSDGQKTTGPDPSVQSDAPINIPRELPFEVDGDGRPVDEGNGKPRNRKEKGFLGRFKSSTSEGTQERDDSKSVEKQPKFTVASQIRATVFNSWINVLIIAAPVGSMFCSLSGWLVLIAVAVALYAVHSNPVAVFVVNFIAIM